VLEWNVPAIERLAADVGVMLAAPSSPLSAPGAFL